MKKKNLLLLCSDDAFYSIAGQLWAYCAEQQAQFEGYNHKFTPAYIEYARQRVEAAAQLPNAATLQANVDSTKRVLHSANKKSKRKCQELFAYIVKSFPKGDGAYMCREAGSNYYAMDSIESWCGTGTMLSMAIFFINTYELLLLAAGMPEDYKDALNAIKQDFDNALRQYTDAKQNYTEGCKQKTEAKNEVFEQLGEVIEDGIAVFYTHPPKKKYFALQPAMKLMDISQEYGHRFTKHEVNAHYSALTAAAV